MESLRAAVSAGLHLDNARAIVRRCDHLLRDREVANPIVILAIRACAARVEDRYPDGVPMGADLSDQINSHLLPAIDRVILAMEGRQLGLIKALNDLAVAYEQAFRV